MPQTIQEPSKARKGLGKVSYPIVRFQEFRFQILQKMKAQSKHPRETSSEAAPGMARPAPMGAFRALSAEVGPYQGIAVRVRSDSLVFRLLWISFVLAFLMDRLSLATAISIA